MLLWFYQSILIPGSESDDELDKRSFLKEPARSEPKSKHYNKFQIVTHLLIKKYDGRWENFIASNPNAVKEVILKFG